MTAAVCVGGGGPFASLTVESSPEAKPAAAAAASLDKKCPCRVGEHSSTPVRTL